MVQACLNAAWKFHRVRLVNGHFPCFGWGYDARNDTVFTASHMDGPEVFSIQVAFIYGVLA